MREVGGNCLKYLKRGGKEKRVEETKILKRGATFVNGGLEPPYKLLVTLAVNIRLECIERNTFFKIGQQFNVFFISNSLQRKMID